MGSSRMSAKATDESVDTCASVLEAGTEVRILDAPLEGIAAMVIRAADAEGMVCVQVPRQTVKLPARYVSRTMDRTCSTAPTAFPVDFVRSTASCPSRSPELRSDVPELRNDIRPAFQRRPSMERRPESPPSFQRRPSGVESPPHFQRRPSVGSPLQLQRRQSFGGSPILNGASHFNPTQLCTPPPSVPPSSPLAGLRRPSLDVELGSPSKDSPAGGADVWASPRGPQNRRLSRVIALRSRAGSLPPTLQLFDPNNHHSPSPRASPLLGGEAMLSNTSESPEGTRGFGEQLSFFSPANIRRRRKAQLGLLGDTKREWFEAREGTGRGVTGADGQFPLGGQMGPYTTIFDPKTGTELAMWEVHRSGGRAAMVARELSKLAAVHHPNVLRTYGADVKGQTSILFTEIPGKSLRNLVSMYDLSPEVLRKYARHALRGLAHLQSKCFVHGRLDQDHICVTSRGMAQICLYGVTEAVFPGSPTKKDDVWSLGTVMKELGGPPDLVDRLLIPGRRADEVLGEEQQMRSEAASPLLSPRRGVTQGSPSGFRHWRQTGNLGRGSFGEVYKVVGPRGEGPMAMKLLQFNSGLEATTALEEIQTHQELMHANIVRYGGFRVDGGQLSIYMELMTGGTLAALVKKTGTLQDCLVARYMRQILGAIDYLHTRPAPILHRDLKGLNVLLTEDLAQAKISDFGAAKVQASQASPKRNKGGTQSVGGTVLWMAPEIFRGVVTTGADIWASGCVMVEMLTGGGTPWPSDWQLHEAIFRIGQWKPEDDQTMPPAVPKSLSEGARDLLLQCFQLNFSKRPSAADLLRHAFVATVRNRSEDFALETIRERLKNGWGDISCRTGSSATGGVHNLTPRLRRVGTGHTLHGSLMRKPSFLTSPQIVLNSMALPGLDDGIKTASDWEENDQDIDESW
eukprot:Hpha_TRINITY_DN16008_c3_g1::TRINITY_DN16008_c3_g1_i1::g.120515::m.120515/K11228/STE11; mitogen-activated protein kinase kinase kinase